MAVYADRHVLLTPVALGAALEGGRPLRRGELGRIYDEERKIQPTKNDIESSGTPKNMSRAGLTPALKGPGAQLLMSCS